MRIAGRIYELLLLDSRQFQQLHPQMRSPLLYPHHVYASTLHGYCWERLISVVKRLEAQRAPLSLALLATMQQSPSTNLLEKLVSIHLSYGSALHVWS